MNLYKLKASVMVLLIPILLLGCTQKEQADEKAMTTSVSHSWAFEFVHWNDVLYRLTDIRIVSVDRMVGTVESLITDETIIGHGVYSNRFAEGTKLYSISEMSTDDAIAVKMNDGYYKMVNTVKERAEQKDQ
ncbi:hypothetical protein [Paenibacillus dokdonensis]|uniref:hypothetical protein n=1 Tax=Paenibacillus dokdonensis TaxID=2567944 RepID=UPI001457AC5D|nr:hypothetical protein [Paenibacillus dokdonensis]